MFLPHANKVQLNQVSTTAFLTTPTKALELDGPAVAHVVGWLWLAGDQAPEGCVTLPALLLEWEVCCKALSQAVPFSDLDIFQVALAVWSTCKLIFLFSDPFSTYYTNLSVI